MKAIIGCAAMMVGMAGIGHSAAVTSSQHDIGSVGLMLAAVLFFVGGLITLAKREVASVAPPGLPGFKTWVTVFYKAHPRLALWGGLDSAIGAPGGQGALMFGSRVKGGDLSVR